MKFFKYAVAFVFGFLIAKFVYEKQPQQNTKEEVQIIANGIQNLSKLVVSKGSFSEIYSFQDSKKYFFEVLSFDKKAIVSVNAKAEVGYDLSKLNIQLDSIEKKIIIKSIPKEQVSIFPDIKYYDLQESSFNSFSSEELNKVNQKAILKLEETIALTNLKTDAKKRLLEELAKIFQLSKVYGWEVVNQTNTLTFDELLLKN